MLENVLFYNFHLNKVRRKKFKIFSIQFFIEINLDVEKSS